LRCLTLRQDESGGSRRAAQAVSWDDRSILVICASCGKNNADTARFCAACGASLAAAARSEPERPASPGVVAATVASPFHPAVQAALARKEKTIRWSLILAAVGTLTLITLVILVAETAVGVLPLAILLALYPLPLYVAYTLWIDRYEPEPRWLLLVIFVWGALVSTLIAFVLNSVGGAIVGETLGGGAAEIYTGSISAPVVEEAAKAGILLIILWRWRRLFNGPLDGAVYGILVGLGFAMTENVAYYGRGAVDAGVDGALANFVVRGVLSPFIHPLFTAMTGIGLGIAVRSTRRNVKIAAPIAGYALAVGLHSLWNTTAGISDVLLAVLYVLFFIPLLVTLVVLGLFATRREGRVVRDYLPPDVVPPEEAKRLYSLRTRLGDSWDALRKGGIRGWRDREDYVRAVSEVAFERYREAHGIRPSSTAAAPQQR
jgi:protease PrsW